MARRKHVDNREPAEGAAPGMRALSFPFPNFVGWFPIGAGSAPSGLVQASGNARTQARQSSRRAAARSSPSGSLA